MSPPPASQYSNFYFYFLWDNSTQCIFENLRSILAGAGGGGGGGEGGICSPANYNAVI